jgi:hypothetical protein
MVHRNGVRAYRQKSAGALTVTIGRGVAGSGFGQLNVAAMATLAGELRVAIAAGFSPRRGEEFLVLRYLTREGKFARLSGRPRYSVSYRRSGADVIYR